MKANRLISRAIVVVAGFQKSADAYGVLVAVFMLLFGLFKVQYNTLLIHLYEEEERPKKFSYRYLV